MPETTGLTSIIQVSRIQNWADLLVKLRSAVIQSEEQETYSFVKANDRPVQRGVKVGRRMRP